MAGHIAYLVNQYPKVSHTFIRREILALERLGWTVERFAVRRAAESTLDDADTAEQRATRYLLDPGAFGLLRACLSECLRSPQRWFRACRLAWSLGRPGADRPMPVHAIYLAEACVLAAWLRRSRVTLVHAHFGTNPAEVALLASTLVGIPFSFTVHGPEEFDRPEALRLKDKCRHAAFVVAVSSYGRSQLMRWLDHRDWPRVHVVHCGLDAAFLSAPASPVPEAPRLVCVGRLCPQKGQRLLVEAAARLRDAGMAFELVLAGDGEDRHDLEALIANFSLADRIRITGWISGEQVREQLVAARALVLPSFAEGLPVVLMEAMALGRPVLSTYVAGIPELVHDGRHGWLFPAGDVRALAEALRSCLQASPSQLQSMGDQARLQVVRRHDVDQEAACLAEAFTRAGAL